MKMAQAILETNPQLEVSKTDRLKLHNKAQLVSDLAVNLANRLLLSDPNVTDVNNAFDLLSEIKIQMEKIDQDYRVALNRRLEKKLVSSGI
ncbi:hypothetical protein [Exiguobacterium sp. s133]|uniref:hypothetical protein n=1 Tax=Exiguobacterium sp. s133 TaxID=2751213 RepID=UPI001BEC1935|nr:hypothetical protein [Exiguobacterium sp. s133]